MTIIHEQLPSSAEMVALDRQCIASGTSSLKLMESAGAAAFKIIQNLNPVVLGRISILVGPGNNGGDGLVIARLLKESGINSQVFVTSSKNYSEDFLTQLHKFLATTSKVYLLPEKVEGTAKIADKCSKVSEEEAKALLDKSTLVIDALLGTGQTGEPRESVAQLLHLTTRVASYKISIDIPTGVNADTGQVYEPHFKPDATLALQAFKRGLFQFPARKEVGQLECLDIGIPLRPAPEFSLINAATLVYPMQPEHIHKYQKGNLCVVGGSNRFAGAPVLSAHASLRAGAGIVQLISPSHCKSKLWPEIIHTVLSPDQFSEQDVKVILQEIQKASCIVVGPGMQCPQAVWTELLPSLINLNIPLVLDAEALNFLATQKDKKNFVNQNCLITPHPGEAARLLGTEVKTVQNDRYSAAKELFSQLGCTIVLKGAQTIVYGTNDQQSNKNGHVLDYSAAYLATAGSGDVLAGIVGSFIAQGLGLRAAAALGVYVHAICGQRAHTFHNGPIIASDIIEALPWGIGQNQDK